MHIDEQTLIYFGCLVVAVILHEISHGVVALWFGDRTAKDAGRLTLNPIPHIDPFGSIVLPAMGAIVGLPVFGYAKPVPVNPSRLRKPRRDMLYVSLAGPGLNLGVFNLLPIPPLDGSALLERVLPAQWLPGWYKFRPYGLLVLLVLIFWTGAVSKVLDPLANQLFDWVFR